MKALNSFFNNRLLKLKTRLVTYKTQQFSTLHQSKNEINLPMANNNNKNVDKQFKFIGFGR